jgi:Ca2+-binding RTX toxin-like protein
VERSATDGLQQRNDLLAGGRLRLDLFDNVFAHAQGYGIRLDAGAPGTLVLRSGHNDTFANGSGVFLDGLPKGPGHLTLDPRFMDRASGNLRLKATSPLIDRGVVCSPGGVANPDAAGHHRLAGRSVDIGAHERGAGRATGVALTGRNGEDDLVGTDASDILCGMGGSDVLLGKGGRDHLDGGGGPDLLRGGAGPDRFLGGHGDDLLCARDGVSGNDRLDGGGGDDGFRADGGDPRTSVEHLGSC